MFKKNSCKNKSESINVFENFQFKQISFILSGQDVTYGHGHNAYIGRIKKYTVLFFW